MNSQSKEMPISLMLVILLYFVTGTSEVVSALSGKGLDVVGVAMLPVGIALFLRKPSGVLGLKLLGGTYTLFWLITLLLGSVSESGSAHIYFLEYTVSIDPVVAHLFFALFCLGQLYVAFLSAPKYYNARAAT